MGSRSTFSSTVRRSDVIVCVRKGFCGNPVRVADDDGTRLRDSRMKSIQFALDLIEFLDKIAPDRPTLLAKLAGAAPRGPKLLCEVF